MINLIIIGGGKGGTSLIEHLHNGSNTRILGVADKRSKAPGILLAKKLNIPTTTDYKKLLKLKDLHFIIDVSKNKKVQQELSKFRRNKVEVISGATAHFLWEQIVDRVKRKDMIEQLLFQYQSIYDIGLKLTGTQSLSRLLFYIVEDATKLTNTPAGSVALFDEGKGQMSLGAVKGFSPNFSKNLRWTLRKGGLTHAILNAKEPLVIKDVLKHPQFDNPIMLKENVRALMASPLIADGKIIGIVYVNDFKPRQFSQREVSLLSLTSSIAATTIEKARSLEIAMMLAITDGLTGLYNHRYFIQRLSQEINRGHRYDHTVALALFDIDSFKSYNDKHGHLKGNDLLRQLGTILKEQFRDIDVISRFGGEEFAVIIPEASMDRAKKATERLIKTVADFPFDGREAQPGRRVTLSGGLAVFPVNGHDDHTLIEQADAALYEAKRRGKNRMVTSSFVETKALQPPPRRLPPKQKPKKG